MPTPANRVASSGDAAGGRASSVGGVGEGAKSKSGSSSSSDSISCSRSASSEVTAEGADKIGGCDGVRGSDNTGGASGVSVGGAAAGKGVSTGGTVGVAGTATGAGRVRPPRRKRRLRAASSWVSAARPSCAGGAAKIGCGGSSVSSISKSSDTGRAAVPKGREVLIAGDNQEDGNREKNQGP